MAKVVTVKRNIVPVALVSSASDSILLPYATQIINSLQALHPQTQLLITCITPTSHSIPINPFLPPAAFLSKLPSFSRRPTRPASTLWQSSTGMLRAIKLARRRLVEGTMQGAGGEGNAKLPKYVVVVSGTDVENSSGTATGTGGGGSQDVWWEDPEEMQDSWETLAKTFTKGQHNTTLFSLISLGATPNLEAFWRESSGKFPPHLIYNSTTANPPPGFSFPLVSIQHACFLIGFYNANRPAQLAGAAPPSSLTSTPQSTNSPVSNTNAKRPAPSSPVINLNAAKKSKPNPTPNATSSSLPLANSPPNPAGAFLTGNRIQGQPTPPNPSRTPVSGGNLSSIHQSPHQPQPQQQQRLNGSPSMAPPLPTAPLTNESLQQYINEMKAVAARTGQPPPSAQDIQNAAMAAYANAQRSSTFNNPQQQPSNSSLPSTTPRSTTTPLTHATTPATSTTSSTTPSLMMMPPIPQSISQLTPQQLHALPAIPHEMKVKIEAHLDVIKNKVRGGQMSQEEGERQVKRLQDLANHQRLKMHQLEMAKQQQQYNQGGQQQPPSGLGLNISPNLSHARQPSTNPPQQPQQQNSSSSYTNQYPPPQQQQQQPQPQQPPKVQRQDSLPHKPIWRGAISWALTEASGARKEFTIYCEAAPMQSSAQRELSEIQLPPTFRIASLSQLKMPVLQELASKHTLPAISLTPLSNSVLPPELVKKQEMNGHQNEALYTMFAQSIEHRSNCGIVRFSGTPNGLVLVAVPNQNRLLAIVFAKIPLPSEWTSSSSSSNGNANPTTTGGQNHSRTSTNQSNVSNNTTNNIVRPPSSQQRPPPPQQQQSGMFSSPAAYPMNLPGSATSSSATPQAGGNVQTPQQHQLGYNPSNVNGTPKQGQQANLYGGGGGGGGSGGSQPFATGSTNYQQQSQSQPQMYGFSPPQQQQQQSTAAATTHASFPAGGVAGMDFAELQKLLGVERLNDLMSGI